VLCRHPGRLFQLLLSPRLSCPLVVIAYAMAPGATPVVLLPLRLAHRLRLLHAPE